MTEGVLLRSPRRKWYLMTRHHMIRMHPNSVRASPGANVRGGVWVPVSPSETVYGLSRARNGVGKSQYLPYSAAVVVA